MLAHLFECAIILHSYYSIEELGGRGGGGGGTGTKPGPKPGPKSGKKPSAARFARPLGGAEVLVAVRGPSPGEGGGKKMELLLNPRMNMSSKASNCA